MLGSAMLINFRCARIELKNQIVVGNRLCMLMGRFVALPSNVVAIAIFRLGFDGFGRETNRLLIFPISGSRALRG
jgi:hypothetical protein